MSPLLPLLPPAFRLRLTVAGDELVHAMRQSVAAGELEDGDLFWAPGDQAVRLGVALTPEVEHDRSLEILPVATVALIESLGAVAPPAVAVQVAWPSTIVINGAAVGAFSLQTVDAAGAETAPELSHWLLLGLNLDMVRPDEVAEPGADPTRTDLGAEGLGDIEVSQLVESFARHFLFWTHRWQDQGLDQVRMEWNHRSLGFRGDIVVVTGAGRLQGRHKGLDPDGALAVGEHRLPLEAALGLGSGHGQVIEAKP